MHDRNRDSPLGTDGIVLLVAYVNDGETLRRNGAIISHTVLR